MPSILLKQTDGSTATHELSDEVVTVGRHQNSGIVLDELTASTRHAEIREDEGRFIVKDLHSANGTYLNGTKIEGEAELRDGDVIHFASAEALFQAGGEAKPHTGLHVEDIAKSLASKFMKFGERSREKRPAKKKHPMFVHTVLFWLREDLTPEQIEAFEEGLVALCRIGAAKSAYYGQPAATDRAVVDRSYSFGLTVIFKDQAGHDEYQEDLVHLEFIANFDKFWTRVQIFDFE